MTQEQALQLLKTGRNVFLTGQAGSGKTYVINQYIEYLHAHKINVAITASTGIAATHIGGSTIHSWSGMGIKSNLSQSQMAKLKAKKYLKSRYNQVKVLILDEISMLHRNQFELLDELLKYMKTEPYKAFGGVQLVLSGDFLQLPPVSKENEAMKYRYAFMSPSWVEANFIICYLHSQYRQGNDDLMNVLNEIRSQEFTQTTYNTLQEKVQQYQAGDELQTTRLYTHNLDVDRVNEQFNRSLTSKEKTYKAKTEGKQAVIDRFESYSLISFRLTIKLGARVMFIKNDQEGNYMNGTVGEVTDFSKNGFPIVTTDGGKEIEAKPDDWSIENEKGSVIAKISQVPLRLAWAVTVHKSQGMTLDSAEIDLSKTFEPGQGYVALSRIKSLEGLQLKGINNRALQLDRLAFKADQRFIELSKDAEKQFTDEELTAEQKAFILLAEGDIEGKQSKKKGKKLTTYQKTKQLIEEGFSIAEMAAHRNYTEATIIKHIVKLASEDAQIDISQYRPKDETIRTVTSAVMDLFPTEEDRKQFSLKTVYDHLQGKLSYPEIRLAIAFIELEQ